MQAKHKTPFSANHDPRYLVEFRREQSGSLCRCLRRHLRRCGNRRSVPEAPSSFRIRGAVRSRMCPPSSVSSAPPSAQALSAPAPAPAMGPGASSRNHNGRKCLARRRLSKRGCSMRSSASCFVRFVVVLYVVALRFVSPYLVLLSSHEHVNSVFLQANAGCRQRSESFSPTKSKNFLPPKMSTETWLRRCSCVVDYFSRKSHVLTSTTYAGPRVLKPPNNGSTATLVQHLLRWC